MAATYRYLKSMEKRGLVAACDTGYQITAAGRRCLADWQATLRAYCDTLNRLTQQLQA